MKITRLIVTVLALSLCGCQTTSPDATAGGSWITKKYAAVGSWFKAHEPQFKTSLTAVLDRAAKVAESVVLSAAIDQLDGHTKGTFFDSAAQGLRERMPTILSGDDVAAAIKLWTPAADGPEHWTELATQLAKVYTDAHPTDDATRKAVIEAIAEGLQKARAQAPVIVAANAAP